MARLGSGPRLALPRRSARVLGGYTLLGRPVDVVETSRGCTFDCSFCSIIEMRGRNFHAFPIERVLDDIRDARDHGARAIFLVDDNITLDVRRFEQLCHALIAARLNGLDYTVQAMTSAIASGGSTLAALMRRAGFRYVFLGIENVLEEDLAFLRAASKNARRAQGRRTMGTTRSPGRRPPAAGPASTTSASASWPKIRKGEPGGGVPYWKETISRSVPQTPTARVFSRT